MQCGVKKSDCDVERRSCFKMERGQRWTGNKTSSKKGAITSEPITFGLLSFLVIHYYHFNYLENESTKCELVRGGKVLQLAH